MKSKISKILRIAILLPALLSGLTSCIYDKYDDLSDGSSFQGVPYVVLRLSSISNPSANSYYNTEKIKSVRVVMLSGDTLQVNELYKFTGEHAQGFSRLFTYNTTFHEKDFYIVGNEESIGSFSYTEKTSGNTVTGNDITQLLDSYTVGEQSVENGKALRGVLESLNFDPEFPKEAVTTKDIYLPYSSYYSGIKVGKDYDYTRNPLQMYLVPVATKFYFNFINNRPSNVDLTNVEIGMFNDRNFLMASLEGEETTKTIEGTEYYWIDWLAKISELSHKYPEYGGNLNFNNLYGWINGYNMPAKSETRPRQFLSEPVVIKAADVDKNNVEDGQYKVIEPGRFSMGPFYMPESWCEYKYFDSLLQQDITIQQYTLTLGIHDQSTEATKDPVFKEIPIDNLKALFRNTYVIITVTLNGGDLEIYAEKADWNKHTSKGYVVDTNPN